MSKNKNKNQYGSFHVVKSGYQKYMRYLVTVLVVVIFVVGASFGIFNKFHKVQKAIVVATPAGPIPGWWYQQYFGESVCDKDICKLDADPDKDGLTNFQEYYYHTDPLNAFTVKDKLNDGQLVAAGFDPSRAGHMTFAQVTAPDNILGESLLVQQDFQDLVNQSKDISKIPLPLVAESELTISNSTDDNTYKKYASELQKTINKYFPQQNVSDLLAILKSGSGSTMDDTKIKAGLLAEELKVITVPQQMLFYHKYLIAFFQLLPKVLIDNFDPSTVASDVWYQNAQSLFAVTQKLSLEQQRLNLLLPTKL